MISEATCLHVKESLSSWKSDPTQASSREGTEKSLSLNVKQAETFLTRLLLLQKCTEGKHEETQAATTLTIKTTHLIPAHCSVIISAAFWITAQLLQWNSSNPSAAADDSCQTSPEPLLNKARDRIQGQEWTLNLSCLKDFLENPSRTPACPQTSPEAPPSPHTWYRKQEPVRWAEAVSRFQLMNKNVSEWTEEQQTVRGGRGGGRGGRS